jgi:drug/metabolite transporter (DMT)-like permease
MALLSVRKLADEFAVRRRRALFEGILAGTLFGTAAILIRLLTDIDVLSIALWRLIIAFLVLAAIVRLLKKPLGFSLLKSNLIQVLFLGVLLGLHFVLFVSAVMDTTILNATVLVNTSPIWSLLVSVLLLGVRPTRLAVLGLAISFLGVSIIAYADATSPLFRLNLQGDLEALLAAVVEGFYLSYGRVVRRKMPVLSLMLLVYLVSTFTVLGAMVLTQSAFTFSPVNAEVVLLLLGLGVLPTALAHTLYFSSLFGLKSFETATLALLEPIGATLLGVAVFAEIPDSLFVAGAGLVLCGIFSVAAGK